MIKCHLPVYVEEEGKNDHKLGKMKEAAEKTNLRHPYVLLVLSFLFHFTSSGIEGFFISQSYTFGICGPHKMLPSQVKNQTINMRSNVNVLRLPP